MAKFNTPIVTKQGHIYMTKSLDQITSTKFSKAEASSHIYQPSELEDLTDLEDVVLKDTWPTTDILNKSTIRVKAHFDNAVLTEMVKVSTIGLWAVSAVDGTEFLYAVATAKEAQAYQLDAYTGDGIEELNLEVSLAFSNTDKVEAVVAPDPSSFVTKDFISDMETKTHAKETYEPIVDAEKAHKQLQDNLDNASTQLQTNLDTMNTDLNNRVDKEISKINSDASSSYDKLSGIIDTNAKTASDDTKAAKNEAIQTAKDYSDDQDSINLSNAKAYTDKVSTDDNAATLKSANSYTDATDKANSTKDEAYTDAQVKANSTADQAYTDAQVKANSTADQKYAKDYADKGDSSTLASAKAYSDTQDATNLAAAKTYSDMVGTNTLASAKSYSDDKDTAQTASLKSFTSDSVKTLSDTVNSSYVHNTGTETIDGSKTFTQPVSAVIKPSVIATGTNIDNYFVPGLSVANGVTVSGTGISPTTLTGGVVNLGSVEHNTATQILFRSTTDYSVSGSFYVRSWRSGAWSGWNNIPYVSDLNNALDTVANTYQTKANAATDKTTADATYAKKTDVASTYATKADNAKKITTLKVNGTAQTMDSSGVVSISVPSAEDLADIQKTIEGVKETLENGDIKDLNDGLNKIQTDLKTKLSGVTLNGTAGTVTNNVAALSLDMSQFATTDKIKAAVDDLEIGGTNLLTGTGNHTVTGTGTSGDLSNEDADALLALFKGLEGQTVTLSVGYEYSGFITGSGRNRLGWEIQMVADTITYQTLWYYPDNDSGSGTLHATFVVPKNITKIGYAIGYIQFSGSGTGTLSHLKLEKGSKATDWSPAPEDALLYTDTAVSNLATKDAVSSVTADMKSNYATKTDINTLKTADTTNLAAAKAYTDTKTTGMATSSNITELTNKFNSYSTTAQMNTAISNARGQIEVGGTNLLRGSGDFTGWGGNKRGVIDANVYPAMVNYARYTATTNDDFLSRSFDSYIPGREYTFSFWARGSGKLTTYVYPEVGGGDNVHVFSLTSTLTKYQFTFTFASTDSGIKSVLFRNNINTLEAHITRIKLEQGEKATAWSPAPEDSWGWRVLDGAIDLNSLTTTGNYLLTGTTTNAPTTPWMYIKVGFVPQTYYNMGDTSGRMYQEVWKDNDPITYKRVYSKLSWSAWSQYALESELVAMRNTDAANLTAAKSYTDTKVSPLATTAALNTLTSTVASNKTTAKSQADSALTSAKAYTDTSVKPLATAASVSSLSSTVANNLTTAKSYTDTQDTATLASAKAYADTQDAATVDISIWHNETMRNGFTGNVHWRTLKFASSDAMLVEIIGSVGNLAGNSGKYMCDFPGSLVPAREIPFTWAQPRNNDFDKVGISVGGNKTSIRLNFTAGGPSNLGVDIHQVYWTDIV